MNYIALFWDLEQKSKITHKKEKRVKEIKEELKIQESVQQKEDEIANLNSQLVAYVKRRGEIENEIFEDENRLKALVSEMEANKYSTPKEIKLAEKNKRDIQERLENLRKALKSIDEEISERKSGISRLEKEISSAKKTIETITAEYKKLEKEIAEEKSRLKQEFEEKTVGIPQSILSKYLEIRESFQTGAISQIDDGFCGSCGVRIPAETLEALMESKGDRIVRCEICGKILYVPQSPLSSSEHNQVEDSPSKIVNKTAKGISKVKGKK